MKASPITSNRSGLTGIELLLVLTLVGALGFFVVKPKAFDSQSKNAAASQVATTKVDETVKAQSAAAAGQVAAIAQVNAQAPDSPQKKAIAAEIPVVLAKLEPPDLKAENESLKRMNAVIEGKLELAASLYEQEAKKTNEQSAEIAKAKAERKAVDRALDEAAAANLAKERMLNIAYVLIALLLAATAYLKFFGINRATLGNILADIRAGVSPTLSFDTHLAPWHHAAVNKAARLATPVNDVSPNDPQP